MEQGTWVNKDVNLLTFIITLVEMEACRVFSKAVSDLVCFRGIALPVE